MATTQNQYGIVNIYKPMYYSCVDIGNDYVGTTSTSGSLPWGKWQYNASEWPDGGQISFEAQGANENASGWVNFQIYDVTGNTWVGQSTSLVTGTSFTGVRNNHFVDLSTLTDGHEYSIAWWTNDATMQADMTGGRFIIRTFTQHPTARTTYINLTAVDYSITQTSYTTQYSYQFLYEASKWDGSPTFKFEATMEAQSTGSLIYAQLYDLTAGAAVSGSEIHSTATSTWERIRSGNITLTDGHIYVVQRYTSSYDGTNSGILAAAQLIVSQTAPTKWQVHAALSGLSWETTGTTVGWNPEFMFMYGSEWAIGSSTWHCDMMLYTQNTATTAYGGAYTNINGSIGTYGSTTSTTPTRFRMDAPLPSGNFNVGNFDVAKTGIYTTNATYYAYTEADKYVVDVIAVGTTTTKTQTGKTRVTVKSSQTITAKGRITVKSVQTVPAKSRITALAARTQQGKSRLTVTSSKTQAGKGLITGGTQRQQPAISRITNTVVRTILGKSRLTDTTTRSQSGRANLNIQRQKPVTGFARIIQTVAKTITGIANIRANKDFTYGAYNTLPTSNTDLPSAMSQTEITNVSTLGNQTDVIAANANKYRVFQFKQYYATPEQVQATWTGKVGQPTSLAMLYLQVYNLTTSQWETIATDTTTAAGGSTTINGDIPSTYTDYFGSDNFITFRVYQ